VYKVCTTANVLRHQVGVKGLYNVSDNPEDNLGQREG
jgi:hypothetical protein